MSWIKSDDLVDLWGDGFSTEKLALLKEEDGSQKQETEAPPSEPHGRRKITWDDQLETQPYYVYKYYMQTIRELVGDMGVNKSEKEMRQTGRTMWPKYSNKLNAVREAKKRHKQKEADAVTDDEEQDKSGNKTRLLRRKINTGTWGNVLDTTQLDSCHRIDIESEPYYVYQYFMNLVRQLSRGMGYKHTTENIRRMGVKLWPAFEYKDFLVNRALKEYRQKAKAGRSKSNSNENTKVTKKGVDEETQTEDEASLDTPEPRKPTRRSAANRTRLSAMLPNDTQLTVPRTKHGGVDAETQN